MHSQQRCGFLLGLCDGTVTTSIWELPLPVPNARVHSSRHICYFTEFDQRAPRTDAGPACFGMEFAEAWEIQSTCEHIIANGYTRVTLQFPDDMLQDAPLVADALQQDLVQRLSAAKVTAGLCSGSSQYLGLCVLGLRGVTGLLLAGAGVCPG